MGELRNKDGTIICMDGDPSTRGRPLLILLMDSCNKANGHRVVWGDYRRVMKHRKDDPRLVAKCKTCGKHVMGDDASKPMDPEKAAAIDRKVQDDCHNPS